MEEVYRAATYLLADTNFVRTAGGCLLGAAAFIGIYDCFEFFLKRGRKPDERSGLEDLNNTM